ncbi:hypothetical protein [Qipengyuania sediminis]|uniref:hypothetical protein n=1 Tax=Qipengyuania sediminis TaxID=1532023 RepID=UPI001059449E|nr:hypothetical protein [Qipengyuania sediminis]
MKAITAALALLMLAGCATGASPVEKRRAAFLGQAAEPSAVIAAELAFAREAQERGQWTAFRDTAADGAIMFVPDKVDAKTWLRGRADPPQAVRWEPHEVWSSCDGTLAITRGAAQWPDGRHGDFLTIWERQRGGGYKWIVDVGQFRAEPLPAPEFVQTHVATCRPAPDPAIPSAEVPVVAQGRSADNTLRYAIVQPSNGVVVRAGLWDGTTHKTALTATFVME